MPSSLSLTLSTPVSRPGISLRGWVWAWKLTLMQVPCRISKTWFKLSLRKIVWIFRWWLKKNSLCWIYRKWWCVRVPFWGIGVARCSGWWTKEEEQGSKCLNLGRRNQRKCWKWSIFPCSRPSFIWIKDRVLIWMWPSIPRKKVRWHRISHWRVTTSLMRNTPLKGLPTSWNSRSLA